MKDERPTLGSICAGIGGFDLGFERAGWRTAWQIELDDVNRVVLADRFPHAQRHKDARAWRSYFLSAVDCISFGSPCQNISVMGAARKDRSQCGLDGDRSQLFFTCVAIVNACRPKWVVFENVPALLHSSNGLDFEKVIRSFAELGYLGHYRVLDAQYFGVPQRRRRLFLVAGLGRLPGLEFLDDAKSMDAIPSAHGSSREGAPADAWTGYTLCAPKKQSGNSSQINLGAELLVAEEDGWDQMAERAGTAGVYGVP